MFMSFGIGLEKILRVFISMRRDSTGFPVAWKSSAVVSRVCLCICQVNY